MNSILNSNCYFHVRRPAVPYDLTAGFMIDSKAPQIKSIRQRSFATHELLRPEVSIPKGLGGFLPKYPSV